MRYKNRKPTPRNMTIKYAGKCLHCGATINAGEYATFYPHGSRPGMTGSGIAHIGNADNTGISLKCFAELERKHEDAAINDYAGDGLDARWEDTFAEMTR